VIGMTLRLQRRQSGLTLSTVAERSGIAVPNLSAIENERRDPTARTVERIADAIGVGLIAAPLGGRATVADGADAIGAALKRNDARTAYRALIQVADDLRADDPATRFLLTLNAPAPISPEWDAAIAGVTEWRLKEAKLPSPAWVTANRGLADAQWSPPSSSLVAPLAPRQDRVPRPLRDRGVLIEADELTSV
jgi:transcriptional regulator with XRE-family HTH domain